MKTLGGVVTLVTAAAILVAGCSSSKPSSEGTGSAFSSAVQPSPLPLSTEGNLTPGESIPSADVTTDAAGPQELPIGQELSISSTADEEGEGAEGSASIKVTKVFTAKIEPTEYGSKPDHGLFVIVRVTATGTQGAVDFNPLEFYLSTAEGDHYEDPTYSDAWGPNFTSGSVHSGERIRGTLVYDVSKSAKHGAFYYSPNRTEEPLAVWRY